MLKLIGLGKN